MLKSLGLLSLLALLTVTSVGCSTPTLSEKERANAIGRNWAREWQQFNDDVDHVLLLRPMGQLTRYHLR